MIILAIDKRFEVAIMLLLVTLFYPVIGIFLIAFDIEEMMYLQNIWTNISLVGAIVILIGILRVVHFIKRARIIDNKKKLPVLTKVPRFIILLGHLLIVLLYFLGGSIVTLGYLNMGYRLILFAGLIGLIGLNFIITDKGIHSFYHVIFFPYRKHMQLYISKEIPQYFIKHDK